MTTYKEGKKMDFPAFEQEIMNQWNEGQVFKKSLAWREKNTPFIFYEGPPSANGMPGIHHVMARTVKDTFCRFKSLQGFYVPRKGGWDTHGLPVELQVEKELGISREEIGKSISVAQYNQKCRETVMRYKSAWDDLTRRMGYWVDLDNPYITYETNYIESLWQLLARLHNKGLLYKGYTIQPYSPAAGTGLSTHELNQPGTYRDVKDTSAVALFTLEKESLHALQATLPFLQQIDQLLAMAWTTTPWTLPSNTALAVGAAIDYAFVATVNPYSGEPITVVLAQNLLPKYFSADTENTPVEDFHIGDKKLPWSLLGTAKGHALTQCRYEPLLPYARPSDGDAYKIVSADFVTTDDGTGIVHIAPSFGADDFKTAKTNGLGSLTLVDKRGRFTQEVNDPIFPLAGRFVKEDYLTEEEKQAELAIQQTALKAIIPNLTKYLSADELITLKLKLEGKAFRIEKYEHAYPHCWRTDKPVLYYPLDSWFIRSTALKDRMVALNRTINWKPESTGTGRFGNWLENLQDWNLSRSRYWGTPLPIWRTEDASEEVCIGSIEQLNAAIREANQVLGMNQPEFGANSAFNDLHRPFVDEITLVSSSGKPMKRETDLIDVWFDSGAMPYAQAHYPFESEHPDQALANQFPADFIAEGVDQTRGWFFTLHALATLLFDSVAFKNVVSNGLVLDKDGNKMSKSKGNVVDPNGLFEKYGADAVRWYLLSNSDPWDNLKFDTDGVAEVQRKFFGTLYNTYQFFALYANIDGFTPAGLSAVEAHLTELDRWILSRLNTLIKDVTENLEAYEPTPAARAMEEFVDRHLSNWYVRLSRRRFWKEGHGNDKQAAFEVLHTCLSTVSQLMAPIAPFFADWLFQHLNPETPSVHLTDWPKLNEERVSMDLNAKMEMAQRITSLVMSIRKKTNIRVRQPLNQLLIPAPDQHFIESIKAVESLILAETNVKEIRFEQGESTSIVKKAKPNFKLLGAKLGAGMKEAAALIQQWGSQEIQEIEKHGQRAIQLQSGQAVITINEVEITANDIPGWEVAVDGNLTVALDIEITPELHREGLARELVNRLQNLRKEKDFAVTDKIIVHISPSETMKQVVDVHGHYICNEILATTLEFTDPQGDVDSIEIENLVLHVQLRKN